jgi:hypothetical protein
MFQKKKILYILEIRTEFNLFYKLKSLKFKIVPASFSYIYLLNYIIFLNKILTVFFSIDYTMKLKEKNPQCLWHQFFGWVRSISDSKSRKWEQEYNELPSGLDLLMLILTTQGYLWPWVSISANIYACSLDHDISFWVFLDSTESMHESNCTSMGQDLGWITKRIRKRNATKFFYFFFQY